VAVFRPKYEIYDSFKTVYEVLITNRKSHGPSIGTDIGDLEYNLERRNSPYFASFHRIRSIWMEAYYVKWLKITRWYSSARVF